MTPKKKYSKHCSIKLAGGVLRFSKRLMSQYDKRIPSDERSWVRTKDRRANWPILQGRAAYIHTDNKYVVIGFGLVPDKDDNFFWRGSPEQYRAVWESNEKMEPVQFDFQRAA